MDEFKTRWRTHMAFVVVIIGALVPLGQSATTCAAPRFDDIQAAEGGDLRPGAAVDVEGAAFFSSDCDDTPGTILTSCSSDEPVAYEDIPLSLKQGNRVWTLGTSSPGDDPGQLLWHVRLPTDLKAGTATLQAHLDSSGNVTVDVPIEE